MSQTPSKAFQKMCKSPKNATFQIKQEKIDYENMSTNCTVVGSNNLNLVKKPQLVSNVSPAYSHPSPNYPPSPYSSPASLKSPSPSLKPPTPQPSFPVMQIIHNNNIITRPIQTSQPQNVIKLKPHLNILPKPSASPQPSPKPSVSPQIVIPAASQQTAAATATLMPTAQPLLINQMPMLAAPGVQFILRPQTSGPMTTAGAKLQATSQATQGLILQPACATQQLLQLGGPARSQPMVRVLANGMQLAPSSTTYVTTQVANQPINATQIQQTIVNNTQQHHQHQQQQIHIQQQVIKKRPKLKLGKKKLDLANIMKLSGIGDEDDIQFESDTSQSESEHNSVPTTPQPPSHSQPLTPSNMSAPMTFVQAEPKKNIQNIQISAMPQQTINTASPVVQVLNQNFQSGMISNSNSQAAASAAVHASGGLPFNSTFITPNFTINNGLMLQRSGGFKLTMGEDGRLVLQHDPTLNQDLQGQLILQGLLGGLVLQPSMDQQTVQQTVQTIQQQSVQTIQQQTVQSQTIQTVQQQTVQPQVQHTIQSLQPQIQQQTVQQTIQHQTVNALQHQPMQIVQPQPIHSIHSQVPTVHSIAQSQVHNLQSQIQSLLQQQNVQVQAQTVHQNVPQNALQNLAQNVQNLAQSSVQNVVAQNAVQNLAQNMASQSSVVQQNMSQSASLQNVVAQASAVQNVVSQNMTQGVQNVQPVQAQSMQTSVHSVQGFQQAHTQTTQPILKVQPFQKSQPPVQTVQPIQHQSHQQHNMHENQSNQQQNNPTSYVVNLTPEQLEQLKRNGQVTVNGQTIFMQRPNKEQNDKKLSPKMKPVKKLSEIKSQGMKTLLQEGAHGVDNVIERKPLLSNMEQIKSPPPQNVKPLSSPSPQPVKHILPHNHVQPIQNKTNQPQALVQPSVQNQVKLDRQKSPISPQKQQKVSPTVHSLHDSNGATVPHDVDKLLGQILEETGVVHSPGNGPINAERHTQQRITTIQLTPQKQQHLKTIQMRIQALTARLQPGDAEMNSALKGLFAEQQKILASGKLLPPDKVYYLNNQLTIVNPSSLNLPSPSNSIKSEPPSPGLNNSNQNLPRSSSADNSISTSHQSITTTSHIAPRVSVSVATSTGDFSPSAHSTIHHHPSPSHLIQSANHHHHNSTVSSNHQSLTVSQPHNSRLNAIGQVSQLPPLYPKQPQLHSPQLHSPQLPSPKLHSPQISSPQLPSPQPHLHNAIPQQGQPNQPHATGGVHLHLSHAQPNQTSNCQIVKPKQPSPTTPQIKPQHPINHQQQQATLIFQQQQQQHHFQQQQQLQLMNSQQQQQQQQQQSQANQNNKHHAAPHLTSQPPPQLSLAKKAHLIESQMLLDQQEAAKPDVHRPFKDRRDACARLIRYHCFDQPVLSRQDLDKADEIFELTARHFIAKFDKMTDKYKYLLMKESMRQVQTSELMMLDRMFLADEQQSLIRLRQDYEKDILSLTAEPAPPPAPNISTAHQDKDSSARHQESHNHQNEADSSLNEEYDEWACIQRELSNLADAKEANNHHQHHPTNNHHHPQAHQSSGGEHHPHNNLKRTSSSDSRLETLKRFRVDKHTKKHDPVVNSSVQCGDNSTGQSPTCGYESKKCGYESNTSSQANSSYGSCKEEESENNSLDEQVQSAINSILNLQQSQMHQQNSLDLDSILS